MTQGSRVNGELLARVQKAPKLGEGVRGKGGKQIEFRGSEKARVF